MKTWQSVVCWSLPRRQRHTMAAVSGARRRAGRPHRQRHGGRHAADAKQQRQSVVQVAQWLTENDRLSGRQLTRRRAVQLLSHLVPRGDAAHVRAIRSMTFEERARDSKTNKNAPHL